MVKTNARKEQQNSGKEQQQNSSSMPGPENCLVDAGRNGLANAVSRESRAVSDAIDEAHAALAGFEDLASSVPSFVVVGMQSVGKSAVLRRISGFPFPQDSEVCTRVAIELRMRRCRGADEQPCTEVCAKAKAFPVVNSMEDTLKEAQEAVLDGRQFESKDFVSIHTRGVGMPEVTLIDLPGIFFAKTDDNKALEELVSGMVRDRIAQEMALICHVVPPNQDSDTLSTWKMVNDSDPDQRRTVYILTKADLVGSKEEFLKRIKKVAGASPHVQCFIVHGKAEDSASELGHLQNVQRWVNDLSFGNVFIGTEALNAHLEQRMFTHVTQKMPEMRRRLEMERDACVKTLDAIGRAPVSPITIAAWNAGKIGHAIRQRFDELLPEVRAMIETMAGQVATECCMMPLGLVDEQRVATYIAGLSAHTATQDLSPTDVKLVAWITLALETRDIVEKSRKTNNVSFEGRMAALRAWLPKFAEASSLIMESFVDEVFARVKAEVKKAQEETCSEPFKTAMQCVVMPAISGVLASGQSEAMTAVHNMKQWNDGPDLLTTCLQEMEANVKSNRPNAQILAVMAACDVQVYLETVYAVGGFVQVQQSHVVESLQRETMRILRGSFNQIDAVLSTCVTNDIAKLIKEPESSVLKRERHLARERCLDNALKAVRLC
mmetsp:Transcript_27791/g.73455  ORF Transcript_27791/g.73455 Transcript_27791/m.73455 type:complete len:663 (-) Transcript_27791:49-2037(-)